MPSWSYRISSIKRLKALGDPGKIIEYMHKLEDELVDANVTIDALNAQVRTLKNEVSNKNAEIQYLEAVNRGKW